MFPEKLAKMYKKVLNKCWKCYQYKGVYYHLWWIWNKEKKLEANIVIDPEDLKDQCTVEARGFFFLLGLTDRQLENTHGTLFLYMSIAARLI